MVSEETQSSITKFLFEADSAQTEENRREPLGDFFAELYCNLELVGISEEIMKSIVKNVYQVITESKIIIPDTGVRDRYLNNRKMTDDKFLIISCLIRLYITQYNNFVKFKMEKENEK